MTHIYQPQKYIPHGSRNVNSIRHSVCKVTSNSVDINLRSYRRRPNDYEVPLATYGLLNIEMSAMTDSTKARLCSAGRVYCGNNILNLHKQICNKPKPGTIFSKLPLYTYTWSPTTASLTLPRIRRSNAGSRSTSKLINILSSRGASSSRASPIHTRPSSISARPSSISARPSLISARPSSISARPSSISARPSSISARPSSISARLSSISARPSSISARPSSISAIPSSISARLITIPAIPLSVLGQGTPDKRSLGGILPPATTEANTGRVTPQTKPDVQQVSPKSSRTSSEEGESDSESESPSHRPDVTQDRSRKVKHKKRKRSGGKPPVIVKDSRDKEDFADSRFEKVRSIASDNDYSSDSDVSDTEDIGKSNK